MINRRAQVFSGEFLLAYFIFMVVLILCVLLWYNTTRDLTEAESYRIMEERSVDAAEQLVKTSGIPGNWNTSNIESVGLVNESRILSSEKIVGFVTLFDNSQYDGLCNDISLSNYMCNRYLLGLGGYDFYYLITNLNGSNLTIGGVFPATGKAPQNQTRLLSVTRNALLDGEIVKTALTVWYTSAEEFM